MRIRVRAEKDADILNALDLAERLALKITIEGATESWLLAGKLAEREVPVLLGPSIGRSLRLSTNEPRRHAAAYDALRSAGVQTLIGSGGAANANGLGSRFVLENAQLALQSDARPNPGMRALRLVTIDAARFLGIAGQAGVIRRGAAADLVLWSSDPTTGPASVEQVYIDGRPAFTARRRAGERQ